MSERPLILVGADTISGEAVLALLAETAASGILASEIIALGLGQQTMLLSLLQDDLPVQNLTVYPFQPGDIVICTGDSGLGELTVTLATRAGAMVLDTTPLAVRRGARLVHPVINPEALTSLQSDGVIAVW